jgi:hypothetical protein
LDCCSTERKQKQAREPGDAKLGGLETRFGTEVTQGQFTGNLRTRRFLGFKTSPCLLEISPRSTAGGLLQPEIADLAIDRLSCLAIDHHLIFGCKAICSLLVFWRWCMT